MSGTFSLAVLTSCCLWSGHGMCARFRMPQPLASPAACVRPASANRTSSGASPPADERFAGLPESLLGCAKLQDGRAESANLRWSHARDSQQFMRRGRPRGSQRVQGAVVQHRKRRNPKPLGLRGPPCSQPPRKRSPSCGECDGFCQVVQNWFWNPPFPASLPSPSTLPQEFWPTPWKHLPAASEPRDFLGRG